MEFCPYYNAWTFGEMAHGVFAVSRVRCKSWNCEYCSGINRVQWYHRINECSMSLLNDWSFLTITANSSSHRRGDTLETLRKGWRKLLERMRRKYKGSQKWHYVAVYEKHKSGEYHRHVLIDRVIAQKWLKENSVKCGMGFMCTSEQVTSEQTRNVAGYVTKYMVKGSPKIAKSVRRIQASAKFPDNRYKPQGWEFLGTGMDYANWVLKSNACGDIYDVQLGVKIDETMFWENGRYIFSNVGEWKS